MGGAFRLRRDYPGCTVFCSYCPWHVWNESTEQCSVYVWDLLKIHQGECDSVDRYEVMV